MSEQSYLQARIQSLTQAIAATTSTRLKAAWKLDLDATNARLAELAAPAPVPAGPTNRTWGIAVNSNMTLWPSSAAVQSRDLNDVKALDSSMRCDIPWSAVEYSKGQYNWAAVDTVVNLAKAVGLKMLATVAFTPAWARPGLPDNDKYPPVNLADYADFVAACVRRYGSFIRWWEIWNEPNQTQFWQPTPDPARYTAMLKLAYAAIKALDPAAAVVTAGCAPAVDPVGSAQVAPLAYLKAIYAAGGRGSFDAVGHHPYAYPYGISAVPPAGAPAWNQWVNLDALHQVMVDAGDVGKTIWATEYGAPTGPSGAPFITEQRQAEFVTEAWASWTAKPWTGPLFWYCLRDPGTNPLDPESNFGLVHEDGTRKPGFAVFAALPKT